MKTLVITLFILAGALSFEACKKTSNEQHWSTKIVVIEDLTDSFQITPPPDPILALYDFKRHPEQEASFDIAFITDMQLNPVAHLHLNDGITSEAENTSDDAQFREKQITAFYAKARQAFTSSRERFSGRRGRNRSEVFCSIISQLRQLAASHYRQKRVVVLSDLNEHSEAFSTYNSANRKQLAEEPEAVGALLSERCPLPNNLKGISIVFVYQPRTKEDDMRFMDWVGVYQRLLEKRGARISFQASADNFLHNDE